MPLSISHSKVSLGHFAFIIDWTLVYYVIVLPAIIWETQVYSGSSGPGSSLAEINCVVFFTSEQDTC